VEVTVDGVRVCYVLGSRPVAKRPCIRGRRYDEKVARPLRRFWHLFDHMCGKRLAPTIRLLLPLLEQYGEIRVSGSVRQKLLTISPASIDRLLKPERKKFQLKGRTHTKPGSLLKSSIPIRTHSDWDEGKPGFVETDLVAHDGGCARGEYCYSLNLTDIYSEWVEPFALLNRAQKWVFQGLVLIRLKRLPFPLLGVDSDNGGEFINKHLYRYCKTEGIEFTRSRPYRKNDNCYVEQKNFMVVRQYVGYARYETEEEVKIMNELYSHLRLLLNFYHPSQKLISKSREGSKVRKRYDEAKTPAQRLLLSKDIPPEMKDRLESEFHSHNPVELRRKVEQLQSRLLRLARHRQIAEPGADELEGA